MRTLLFLITTIAGLQLMCSSNSKQNTAGSMTAEELLRKIEKGEDLHLKDQVFTEDIDLTQLSATLANVNYYTVAIGSQITFEGCTFKGKFLAYHIDKEQQRACHFQKGITFMDCIFREEVNFKGSTIQGLANFSKSYFEQEAHFEGCRFQSDANFSNTVYLKDIFFQQAHFTKASTFMNANLGGILSFQGAQFDAPAQLGVCEFHEYADFSTAVFNRGAFLDYSKFHGQAVFSNVIFRDRAEFKSCEFDQIANFKGATFYGLSRFNESIIKGAFSLKDTRFVYGPPEMGSLKMDNPAQIELENARYNNYQQLELKF